MAALRTGGDTTLTASHQGQTHRDSAGWTILIPPGWHIASFSDTEDGTTTSGVQLSNLPLPPPSVIPGYPVQVNDQVLPAHGIGLTITADTDTGPSDGPVMVPPLPYPERWTKGSAPAGSPHIEGLSFRVGSTTFAAWAKIGPRVTSADREALAAAIHSLR
jgi:hypothetical protein